MSTINLNRMLRTQILPYLNRTYISWGLTQFPSIRGGVAYEKNQLKRNSQLDDFNMCREDGSIHCLLLVITIILPGFMPMYTGINPEVHVCYKRNMGMSL